MSSWKFLKLSKKEKGQKCAEFHKVARMTFSTINCPFITLKLDLKLTQVVDISKACNRSKYNKWRYTFIVKSRNFKKESRLIFVTTINRQSFFNSLLINTSISVIFLRVNDDSPEISQNMYFFLNNRKNSMKFNENYEWILNRIKSKKLRRLWNVS